MVARVDGPSSTICPVGCSWRNALAARRVQGRWHHQVCSQRSHIDLSVQVPRSWQRLRNPRHQYSKQPSPVLQKALKVVRKAAQDVPVGCPVERMKSLSRGSRSVLPHTTRSVASWCWSSRTTKPVCQNFERRLRMCSQPNQRNA